MPDAPRFRPRGQQDLAPSGQAERARANLAALTVLREVQAAERPAAPAEQKVLARWSGWGALPLIFDGRPTREGFDSEDAFQRAVQRWEALGEVRDQVRALLPDAEWNAARRNTLNAHYTDAAFVRQIWDAVREMGFDGGTVLEPGSGVGNFIGLAPEDATHSVRMTGVELDPTTAAISQLLYPDASIVTGALEDVALPKNAFDAAVGNVPFGRFRPYDGEYNRDRKLSIHDLFVLKALASTRPGGVVALITSRYTLDAADPAARQRLYDLGDLVGAVRLPAAAHRAAAGTDVVTDVLFLRRRAEHEPPGDDTWLGTVERVLDGRPEPVRVNAYYDAHREHVLGRLQTRLGAFGPELTVVTTGTTEGLAARLGATARGIAASAPLPGDGGGADEPESEPIVVASAQGAEGALALDASGTITIIDGGRAVPLEVHPEQRDRLVQLVDLKQKVQALYEAEGATLTPGETPELAELRRQVREAYRAYRRRYPPLSKPRQTRTFTPKEAVERAKREGLDSVPAEWRYPTAFGLIEDDPDAALLFSLDVWNEQTGKAEEQPILTRRMLEPRVLPERADGIEAAIALAMEHDGGVLDMARVAALLGVAVEEAITQANGLAFRDPEQGGAWEPRHRYLSGDVRSKLQAARAAAADDPAYAGNVAALEQVQPADLTPSEIKAKVGAPWIPPQDYTQFLRDLGFADAKVMHAGGTIWEVQGADDGDLATSEWGTPERSAQELFEALLEQAESTIRITYRDREGNTRVDQQATDAAREKAQRLATEFEDWVWRDPERTDRLARIYNDTFNRFVLPEHDTSPLTLPGAVLPWPLRPHQNAAIRRILSDPTVLLGHVVGAGKTATMVAAAMEMRRTGLARKPAIVVPNHLLKQFPREFRQLYPNAKLLAISASDLHRRRRAKFMARIAGGDWDAVILTHEAFNRIPVRPSTERAYLDVELALLRDQLERARDAGMSRRTLKQIEESLANTEGRIKEQLDKASSEDGVFLEDTGIDYLFLDEAHEYKNLRTVSAIPGATIQGSNKATKLHLMLEHLRGKTSTGRMATLATGTPIANSVTEAYVLMRYMSPQMLDRMGLEAFDNWAATFGQVVTSVEPDAKGAGYVQKSRFARFFNVPELMRAYRSFADVQMAEDLKLPTPPVRSDTGGQRGEVVLIPSTGAQRDFLKSLPNQPWISKEGGVLKALGLGLRASLDMRLVGGTEEQGSKIDHVAERVADIWAEHKDVRYPVSASDPTPQELPGALQLVFLDEGTPGSSSQYPVDLYDDLREKLAERGVPREQVRFIHEANNDLKKEKLFADARAGRVAVLIGSTQKMGAGTNVQDRAVALHHVSYPWRPADMGQRDGRIERQGNLNNPNIPGTPDDIRILYYVTERTFDEFRLNTLTRKAKFIGQMQRRDFSVREIEDISDDAVNLGLLTALSSGDPAIMEHAQATAERFRLQGLARSWDRDQDRRAQQIAEADTFIGQATTALAVMRTAATTRTPTAGDAFAITLNGTNYAQRETAATALGRVLTDLAKDTTIRPGQRIPLGRLGGQDFHAEIAYGAGGARMVRLRFHWGHVVAPGHRSDRAQWPANKINPGTGRGALQALENFLNQLDSDIVKLDTEVQQQRQHRAEIAANVRDKTTNPYRQLARSKEREEQLLSQLIVANERESNLAERAQSFGDEDVPEYLADDLAHARAAVARLKDALTTERSQQQDLSEREAPEASPAAPDTMSSQPPDQPATSQEVTGERDGPVSAPMPAPEVTDDAPPHQEDTPADAPAATAETSQAEAHMTRAEEAEEQEPSTEPTARWPRFTSVAQVRAHLGSGEQGLSGWASAVAERDDLELVGDGAFVLAHGQTGGGEGWLLWTSADGHLALFGQHPFASREDALEFADRLKQVRTADGSLYDWDHNGQSSLTLPASELHGLRKQFDRELRSRSRATRQADVEAAEPAENAAQDGEREAGNPGQDADRRDQPSPSPSENRKAQPKPTTASPEPEHDDRAAEHDRELLESAETAPPPPAPLLDDAPPAPGDAPGTDAQGGLMTEQSATTEPTTGPWTSRIHIDNSPARPTVAGTRFEDTELREVLRANNFRWRRAHELWEYNGDPGGRDTAVQAVRNKLAELDRREREQGTAQNGKRKFPPTAQQQAIIDAVVAGLDVAVQALAGTGKTSTLNMVAERIAETSPQARIVYIAFNASIAKEARATFGRNVTSSTAHALALRHLRSGPYADKTAHVGKGVRHPEQIADLLGVEPVEYVDPAGDRQQLAPAVRAQLAMAVVSKFRESADDEISAAHLPDALMAFPGTDRAVLNTARRVWANIADPTNAHLLEGDRPRAVLFDHDDYLKLWALEHPRIDADLIFFDEAQDINPVLRRVVQDQPTQTVVVGDTFQSIYGFRGAEDALAHWPADVTLPLTQSWRFGPEIAARGDDFLRLLEAPYQLTGNPALNSAIGPVDNPDAILCRTNVGAVSEVFRAFGEGKRVALVGGGGEIAKLAKAAKDLKAGRGTKHAELSRFTSWHEVEEAAKEERALQPFVRLIEQHGPDELLRMVDNLAGEDATGRAAPDVTVSTAHKAKGREWDHVRIGDDFLTPKRHQSGAIEALPPAEELRLSYVAVTRGRRTVDLGSLAWIEDVAPGTAAFAADLETATTELEETAPAAQKPATAPPAAEPPQPAAPRQSTAPQAETLPSTPPVPEPVPADRTPQPDGQDGQEQIELFADVGATAEPTSAPAATEPPRTTTSSEEPGRPDDRSRFGGREAGSEDIPVASAAAAADPPRPAATPERTTSRPQEPAASPDSPPPPLPGLEDALAALTEAHDELAPEPAAADQQDEPAPPAPAPAEFGQIRAAYEELGRALDAPGVSEDIADAIPRLHPPAEPPQGWQPLPEPASVPPPAVTDEPAEPGQAPPPAGENDEPTSPEPAERFQAEPPVATPARQLERPADSPPGKAPVAEPGPAPLPAGVDEELEEPLENVGHILGEHANTPEWQRISAIVAASGDLGRLIIGSVGSYRREVAHDLRIHGLWRTATARSARTIATCAYRLSSRIETSASRVVRALRDLARRAADYADRLTGTLPAGRALRSKEDLEQGWTDLDTLLDQPAAERQGGPAWTAWALQAGMDAVRQAWNTAVSTAGAAITSSRAWQTMTSLWNKALPVVDKAHQGVLRFEHDAATMGLLATVWSRTCETLAWGTRQALEHLHAKGTAGGLGWQALRLLHHTAEEALAHLRGLLPRGEHAPLGTYDPPAIRTGQQAVIQVQGPEAAPSHTAAAAPADVSPRTPGDLDAVYQELIAMLDAFDYARRHGELSGGFAQVGKLAEQSAARLGLTRIDADMEVFDPALHEAAGVIKGVTSQSEQPMVGQVLRFGYMADGKVIRPASVLVIPPADHGQAQGHAQDSPTLGTEAAEAWRLAAASQQLLSNPEALTATAASKAATDSQTQTVRRAAAPESPDIGR